MLELLLCSVVTILPDYLLRRRFQGKVWGEHITFFTVWYELRWGITLCAMLTIGMITIVFYYHPSATNVASFFRTVTVLSESAGRVDEVYVENNQRIEAGAPIFRMDASSQEAAAETARRRIAEVDAALVLADSELASANGALDQAKAAYAQALEDLNRQATLQARGSSAVSARDVEVLQNEVDLRQGAIDAARAGVTAAEQNISLLLPAQRASAVAALEQAENEISKLTVYAGVSGTVEQMTLRVGDIVNPVFRPAAVLVPTDAGRSRFQAGFEQISTGLVRKGGLAEMTCLSKPFTVIPMVITEVQDVIAAGQVRPSDRLLDVQQQGAPGTLTVYMEPLYAGQTDDIPPGSTCLANAYTSNHERLADPGLGFWRKVYLHVVDTVGIVHAAGLRIRALFLPLQVLVFSGH